jgi:TonB family protein
MNARTTALMLLAISLALAGVPKGLWSDEAAENLERATQHFQHAEELYRQGKTNKAIAEFREAVQLNPDDPWWHVRFAMTLEDRGGFPAAREQFRLASQLDPDNSTLRLVAEGHMEELLRVMSSPDGAGKLKEISEGFFKVGGDVEPPVAIFNPTPPYSEKARKAKYQGTDVLLAAIDAEGNVKSVGLLTTLGLGLDERAIATVCMWKFKPGARKGLPVPTRILAEISFRLH